MATFKKDCVKIDMFWVARVIIPGAGCLPCMRLTRFWDLFWDLIESPDLTRNNPWMQSQELAFSTIKVCSQNFGMFVPRYFLLASLNLYSLTCINPYESLFYKLYQIFWECWLHYLLANLRQETEQREKEIRVFFILLRLSILVAMSHWGALPTFIIFIKKSFSSSQVLPAGFIYNPFFLP